MKIDWNLVLTIIVGTFITMALYDAFGKKMVSRLPGFENLDEEDYEPLDIY